MVIYRWWLLLLLYLLLARGTFYCCCKTTKEPTAKETSSLCHPAIELTMKQGVKKTRNEMRVRYKWRESWDDERMRQPAVIIDEATERWQRWGHLSSGEEEREKEEEVYRRSCLQMELAACQTLYEGIWATAEFITVTAGLVTDEDMNLNMESESGWRAQSYISRSQLKSPALHIFQFFLPYTLFACVHMSSLCSLSPCF